MASFRRNFDVMSLYMYTHNFIIPSFRRHCDDVEATSYYDAVCLFGFLADAVKAADWIIARPAETSESVWPSKISK